MPVKYSLVIYIFIQYMVLWYSGKSFFLMLNLFYSYMSKHCLHTSLRKGKWQEKKKKAHEVKKASSATDPEPLPWSGLACALPGEYSCSVVLPLSLRFGFQLSLSYVTPSISLVWVLGFFV